MCLLTRESGRKLVQTYKDTSDESKVIRVSRELVERSDGKKFMVMVDNFYLVLFDRALKLISVELLIDAGIRRCDCSALL